MDILSCMSLYPREPLDPKCPTWGGDAVWQARSMLRGFGDYYWDDEAICDEAEPLVSSLSESVSDFRVTPNPTSGDVTIWSGFAEGSFLTVVDAWGRTVRTTSLTGPGQVISMADAPSGIYVLYLQDESGRRAYARVQIVK